MSRIRHPVLMTALLTAVLGVLMPASASFAAQQVTQSLTNSAPPSGRTKTGALTGEAANTPGGACSPLRHLPISRLDVPEPATQAVCVIVAWLAVWTIFGAWRMMTRDT